MSRRFHLENQIYFVTSKTFNNKKVFSEKKNCLLFLKVLEGYRGKYKFQLFGYVVMPDHVHLLIQPSERMTISEIIHRIKGGFAYRYLTVRNHKGSATRDDNVNKRVADPSWVGAKRQRIREHPIWQKSFYDHLIRNDKDFQEKLDYIHKNSLKHNVVSNLDEYLWSSYQNYYLENNSLIKIDTISLS
ncbi:MAG: hypothetical protein A3A24_00740 [Candidatus Buchananbacteria bacterium RIFCSPLOWO2_01_FULL_46_12]|uniref:Transposase IS200-like domain-containing protein n=2 Tax=Candidatus Buchananiibacteriota TaxID=1817903 RepID=A0A1G1YRP7_9BACT|nr:MAG: hypothetical protein A2744_02525 [Candidatus Buchananbacteria bacterium RIFCSPHIGHO2_01_FULL_44_11]OGY55028.1 MAG: hypothetical protein A3A24_00740 [Candidatus Buchananbacteria bacterium RIFCSPLOWO2_01_FULL_46_12]